MGPSRSEPAERHPSDVLRVVIAMSLLLVAIVVARAAAGGDLQRQLYDF
ncbi:MAG: hypothetical protein H0T70_08380, partial [Acidimicrobiia bacterium]|nr:hypothetical protein [Acidimicrobiia bacterium]